MNLEPAQQEELLNTLRSRFETNMHRHPQTTWALVEERLKQNPEKLASLYQMERTGGEPDVVSIDVGEDEVVFCDCSAESPAGRRSLCYDEAALKARKANKPKGSAVQAAKEMGASLLNEEQYRQLQALEAFDQKTSSWLETPNEVRDQGGAIFGDFRYGKVFVYHNGVQSYYAARGFRALVLV